MFTWSLTGCALWFAESTPRVLVPGRTPGTPAGPSWRMLATPLHSHCCPWVTAETEGSSTFWFRDKRNRGVPITVVFFLTRIRKTRETNRLTLVFSGTSQLWWGWRSGWWLWSPPRTTVASSSCTQSNHLLDTMYTLKDVKKQTAIEMLTCGGSQKQYPAWPVRKKGTPIILLEKKPFNSILKILTNSHFFVGQFAAES